MMRLSHGGLPRVHSSSCCLVAWLRGAAALFAVAALSPAALAQDPCADHKLAAVAPSAEPFRRCVPANECFNGSQATVTAGGQVDCERAYSDECHQERCEPIDKRICRVKFDASKSVNLTTVSCGPVGDCKATTTGPRVLCECLLAPFDRSKAAEVACRCACEDICTVNR